MGKRRKHSIRYAMLGLAASAVLAADALAEAQQRTEQKQTDALAGAVPAADRSSSQPRRDLRAHIEEAQQIAKELMPVL